MSETNDTATVEQSNTTEETEVVTTENVDTQPSDLSDIREMLKEQSAKLGKLEGQMARRAKKAKKVEPETPEKTNEADDSDLLQKTFLRSAEITAQDEVDLAMETANKWDIGLDVLVDDPDWKMKLERHRDAKANADATSNVKGDQSKGLAKDSVDYWVAKGTPPTREEVPDRKLRAKIARSLVNQAKTSKTFYND
jgi:hypothetical protein